MAIIEKVTDGDERWKEQRSRQKLDREVLDCRRALDYVPRLLTLLRADSAAHGRTE